MKQQHIDKKESIDFIGKKVVKVLDSIVNLIVVLCLLLLLVFGSYALWDSKQVTTAAQATQYEIYKPSKEDISSFEELQQINDEVFGWINVYGTQIDYPLVQAEDNKKYVNTDSKGDYSLSGSIFLDARNSNDFSDFNSILFGHHMVESAMFGDLAKFKDADYFNRHRYGDIYFNNQHYGIEFFAFLESDSYDEIVFTPAISEDSKKMELRNYLLKQSLRLRDVNVGVDEHIVLLTTCSSALTNGRHVLVGKITKKTYSNEFIDDSKSIGSWLQDSILWQLFMKLPIAIKIIFVLLFILILYLVVDKVNKYIQKRKGKGNDEKNQENKK